MKNYRFYFFLIAMLLATSACTTKQKNDDVPAQSIKVGPHEWTTHNLDVGKFRNGEAIPEVKSNQAWEKAWKNEEPAWCYYENDAGNGQKMGRLYNWFALNDPRGLAPQGWHIPNREEWKHLAEHANDNISYFTSQFGGFRHVAGNFRLFDYVGYWWTANETNAKITAYQVQLDDKEKLEEANAGKGTGFSIRLVRD